MASVPHSLLPDGAKGLVLDCDGTLMDTMSQHWQAWKLACAEFGLGITVDDFIGYAGKPGDEIAKILAGQQVRGALAALVLQHECRPVTVDALAVQGKALDVDAFIKWKRDWYTEQLHTVGDTHTVVADSACNIRLPTWWMGTILVFAHCVINRLLIAIHR